MKLHKLNVTKADLVSIASGSYRIEIDTLDNDCRIETDDVDLIKSLKQRGFSQ